MKAILEFTMWEDKELFEDAINASKYKMKIDTLYDDVFRPMIKHVTCDGVKLSDAEHEFIQRVWEMVFNHFGE